jgi:hypothetical protein
MTGQFNRQHLNRRYRHFNASLAEEIARLTMGMTVSDFGAGIGLYVAYLRAVGSWAIGYDGTPGIADQTAGLVQTQNLATPCDLPATQAVISIEVGEHIPPRFEDAFIDNLCNHATVRIIVSWAARGQRGRNHVNCRDDHELIPLFGRRGWYMSVSQTAAARCAIDKPFNRKLLVFEKWPNNAQRA